MFIEVNCKGGSSRCFEVKSVAFDPKKGISIYGEKDRVRISMAGDIETEFSAPTPELNEVEDCKIPGMIFKKNKGELDDYNDDYAYDDECLIPENGGLLGNLMNPANTNGEEILVVDSWEISDKIHVGPCSYCESVKKLYDYLISLLII